MSQNARRLSKSKDDEKLLENPKQRDRSKKPLILIRLPGPGRATVGKVPIVGEVVWGIIEKYTFGENPSLYTGPAWESIPCTILDIREKDVLISLYVPTDMQHEAGRALVLKVPRVDNHCVEREKDDPYHDAKWNKRT